MVVEAFSECVLRNFVATFTAVTRDPWPGAGPHPVFLFVYPTLHTSHQPRRDYSLPVSSLLTKTISEPIISQSEK